MIASLVGVGLIVVLIALSYTIGALSLRRVGGWTGTLEKAVFAIPVGMGVVSYAVMALGLLRLFRPPLFFGIFGVGVVAVPFAVWDMLRARMPESGAARSRLAIVVGLVLAFLGVCAVIAALAPPTEWDALSYHLAGPKTYLRNGRIFYIPYDHHTNFPFLLQMLYTLMLGVGSIGGAKLCHTLCGALMVASVYTFATRHLPGGRGKRIGAIAALILATTPMVLWEMTVAYSDLSTALYTWLAVYAAMNGLLAAPDRGLAPVTGWLPLSAVFIGFALSTKFTALAYWALLLAGIVIYPSLPTRRLSPATVRAAILWIAVSLAIAAPWYIKTYLYTNNPTYPFLYGLFGGRYWSAGNAAQYTAAQAQLGGEKTPIGLLTSPWVATMFPPLDAQRLFTEYWTFGLSPVYLALLLALPLIGRRLSRPVFITGLFGLGVTAFWFLSVQQTRYLLPALPEFAFVCAEAVVILWELPRRYERWAASGLIGLTAGWGMYLAGGKAFWGVDSYAGHSGHSAASPAIGVVTGQIPEREYIAHSELRGIAECEFWIDDHTPTDAKVALFDLERGFYLDRDYVWAKPDDAYGLIPWDGYRDVDDWLADFKRHGYTTLLIGPQNPSLPDDGERWRSLLDEAIQSDKVTLVFEAASTMTDKDHNPVPVRVYRIP